MNDNGASYRERKEASVSNLTGTTMLELLLVSTPIPMGMWLLSEAKALAIMPTSGWKNFLLEAFAVLLPALASMVWPSFAGTLVVSMAMACIACRLRRTASNSSLCEPGKKLQKEWQVNDPPLPVMGFVTNFRASIMLMTCITILAVDFQVFPRRFAKTEVFGTGLMDLGVGATIFASGLASGCKANRRKEDARPRWPALRAVFTDITSTAIRAWPLAALGVSRLVVIKGLGYQEHVSEYGVHWNFFATLFCMRLIVVPMNRLRPARVRYGLCIIALGVYQWLLVNGGLSDFVVHSPRDTLFAMNREGVLGLVGFVAIFFIAEELGSQFRAQFQKTEKGLRCASSLWGCMAIVAKANAVLWGLTLLSAEFIQPTSRRMVNLTYVLWVSAHSALMLNLLMVVDNLSSKPPRSEILAAINLNMFPVFMVANLSTGAINISMQTLDADTFTAVVILLFYVGFVARFAVTLADRGFMIKV